eukprot:1331743-Pleurochrysis_carterae.AAC.6
MGRVSFAHHSLTHASVTAQRRRPAVNLAASLTAASAAGERFKVRGRLDHTGSTSALLRQCATLSTARSLDRFACNGR